MSGQCVQCGTPFAETGAPIWETYCPNEACDYERKRMFAGVRAAVERREREEYERLKAKFELASGMEAPSGGETVQQGSTEGDSPVGEAETPKA